MTEPKVTWARYKAFSGCRIKGGELVTTDCIDDDYHMDRAYYLTSKLEAPRFGAVQSYDGAGMSGGPMHNIAVYPRSMKQGSLFPLLRHLHDTAPTVSLGDLFTAYEEENWSVERDGKLRSWTTGKLISGKEIRTIFTPPRGRVPRKGANWADAKEWALLHYHVFADPLTFAAQKEYAIKYLLRTQKSYESVFYDQIGIPPEVIHVDIDIPMEKELLTLEEDLAMCVYHSHSVNAPGPARTILKNTLKKHSRGEHFARLLIWSLGKKKYGNWQDTKDGKNRYDRTRYHARRSGLWPKEFFVGRGALMPKDLGSRPRG